jgi:hypothetical protein
MGKAFREEPHGVGLCRVAKQSSVLGIVLLKLFRKLAGFPFKVI